MGKIQFPNLRALPAGPRWLAYGVLLLCAILVGGVITAYGGCCTLPGRRCSPVRG